MTREEALIQLRLGPGINEDVSEEYNEAVNMAIEAIRTMPSEDCISRDAVLDGLASIAKVKAKSDAQKSLMGRVMFFTEHLPSVAPQPKEEPQQKTGHWVLSGGYWRCSECKEKALLKLDKATGGYREYEPVRSKYCPECGAKMQEEKK